MNIVEQELQRAESEFNTAVARRQIELKREQVEALEKEQALGDSQLATANQ